MDNFYILLGPERADIEDYISKLFKKSQSQDSELKKEIMFGTSDEDVDAVCSGIFSSSLFSSGVFYVLEYADLISVSKANYLAKCVAECKEQSILILTSSELSISKALEGKCSTDKKKKFYLAPEAKVSEFATAFFKANGWQIEPEALTAFLSLVEHDKKSVQKFAAELLSHLPLASEHESGAVISAKDVYENLSKTKEDDTADIFAYIAKRDIQSTISSISTFLYSNPRGFVTLISGLVYYLRHAVGVYNNRNAGVDLASPLGFFVKTIAGSMTITNPDEKMNIRRILKNFSYNEVLNLLSILEKEDAFIRTSSDPLLSQYHLEVKLTSALSGKLR